jgi:predicted RNase H-like nuclease (RuvC/YqgF family)
MSKAKSDTNKHRDNLEGDIKEAVEADKDIRETVRCITLKALSEGKLDLNELSQIARCVIKGAGLGAVIHSRDGQSHQLTKAVAGLEDALCSAVEASKLAVEEASSHVNTFSKQDLQRTINDLSELEAMYLETLKDVAKEANEAVSVTLNDLARHGRVSGTAVGQKVTEVSTLLNQQLTERLSNTVAAGVDSAAKVTRNLAYAAAGFLDTFAQKLDEKSTSNSNSNKSQ